MHQANERGLTILPSAPEEYNPGENLRELLVLARLIEVSEVDLAYPYELVEWAKQRR